MKEQVTDGLSLGALLYGVIRWEHMLDFVLLKNFRWSFYQIFRVGFIIDIWHGFSRRERFICMRALSLGIKVQCRWFLIPKPEMRWIFLGSTSRYCAYYGIRNQEIMYQEMLVIAHLSFSKKYYFHWFETLTISFPFFLKHSPCICRSTTATFYMYKLLKKWAKVKKNLGQIFEKITFRAEVFGLVSKFGVENSSKQFHIWA